MFDKYIPRGGGEVSRRVGTHALKLCDILYKCLYTFCIARYLTRCILEVRTISKDELLNIIQMKKVGHVHIDHGSYTAIKGSKIGLQHIKLRNISKTYEIERHK